MCVCVIVVRCHDFFLNFRIQIMSYPGLFRKVNCDSEVFFLRLPSVCLCLLGAGLPRSGHGNAFLLCLLLVFLYFLLRASDRINEMTLKQLRPKSKIRTDDKKVLTMLCVHIREVEKVCIFSQYAKFKKTVF